MILSLDVQLGIELGYNHGYLIRKLTIPITIVTYQLRTGHGTSKYPISSHNFGNYPLPDFIPYGSQGWPKGPPPDFIRYSQARIPSFPDSSTSRGPRARTATSPLTTTGAMEPCQSWWTWEWDEDCWLISRDYIWLCHFLTDVILPSLGIRVLKPFVTFEAALVIGQSWFSMLTDVGLAHDFYTVMILSTQVTVPDHQLVLSILWLFFWLLTLSFALSVTQELPGLKTQCFGARECSLVIQTPQTLLQRAWCWI